MTLNVVRMMFILCCTAAAATVHADDKAEAKKHFQAGLTLLKVEDFKAAAAELDASVRLYPNKNNLYNLANCYRALHRYGEALSMFERVLSEYDKSLKKEMREDTRKQIAEINAIVGRLTLTVNLKGAEIVVDRASIGRSPLSVPLILAPGKHEIAVSLDGHDTATREVELVSGKALRLSFELKESKAAVTVRVDADGAEIFVNDEPAGTSPLVGPLALAKGVYRITVQKEGYEPSEREITLNPGDELEANFDLVRIPSTEPVVQPTPVVAAAKKEKKKRLGPLFWTGVAGTVVLGGVSGAMWGLTVSKRNDYNGTVGEMGTLADDWKNDRYSGTYSEFTTDWAALQSEATGSEEDMNTFKWAAIGTSIGAGAFVVVAVVGATVRSPDERETAFRLEPAPGGLRVRF